MPVFFSGVLFLGNSFTIKSANCILKRGLVMKFVCVMSPCIKRTMSSQVNVGQFQNAKINLAKKYSPLLALLVLKHPLIWKISLVFQVA